MSVPVIVPRDGAFEIHDWAFSADAVAEVAARYIEARDEAESDYDQRRLDHHARWSEPAQQAASDDLREACALRFDSLDDLEAFGCRVAVAVELARKAMAATPVRRPAEWADALRFTIHDPDGWRNDGKSFDEPVTAEEFDRRAQICTISFHDNTFHATLPKASALGGAS